MGFDKNNDPIQDYNPGALKMKELYENLTGDEDYSGRDEDYSETYTPNLHNCSNDLSEEGSIREEREHAKYASKLKQEVINRNNGQGYYGKSNYNNVNYKNAGYKKSNSHEKSITMLLWVILIAMFVATPYIIEYINESNDENYDYDYYDDYNYESGYTSITSIVAYGDYYDSRKNTLDVGIYNGNDVDIYGVKVMVTFYDSIYNIVDTQDVDSIYIPAGETVLTQVDCPENFLDYDCTVYSYETLE